MKAVSESLPTARWKGPHAVLSVCVGSYFAVRFAQVILGPIVPFLLETFGISRGAVGAALTGMWVAYALVQLPSGAASDRFGEARVVTAALVVTAVTSLGLAVAPTFVLFGLAAVGLGVGAGAYYNPATALIEREFDNVGGPVGAHRIGGQLAGVFGPVVAAAAAVGYGWRPVVAAAAVLPVAAASVFVLRFENAGATQEQNRQSVRLGDVFDHEAVLGALARKHTRTTTLMMTLVEFVGLATMAFLPTVLVEGFGFSVGRASLVFAVFFLVSALCQPIGGVLSDRFGRDATVATQATAGVLGYGGLAAGGTAPVAVVGSVLAGVATSATPVLQSRMMDGLTGSTRATGFGLFRTVYLLFGATGTAVVGATADVAGWTGAFGLLSALLAVVVLSAVFFRRRWG